MNGARHPHVAVPAASDPGPGGAPTAPGGLPLLVQALRWPQQLSHLAGPDWSRLHRQARAAGLLGRLAARLLDPAMADHVQTMPAAMRTHLEGAHRVWHAQTAEVRREARWIDRALYDLPGPVVLLKGAAYAVAGLPAASGRVFSDVDLMVPRAHLQAAESRLGIHGWMTTETSDYNQRYYRTWMHELPPMQHVQRGTVVDLHHALVPPTSRLHFDPAPLFDAAVPVPGSQRLHVLAPADMVLHSMTHLLLNDDVSHAWRDLSDLALLVQHFGGPDDHRHLAFWQQLCQRAQALGLMRMLWYGAHALDRIWGLTAPPDAEKQLCAGRPSAPVATIMNAVWQQIFQADEPSPAGAGHRLATAALFIRGHWLRMPPLLLARHLTIKALRLHESDRRSHRPATPQG